MVDNMVVGMLTRQEDGLKQRARDEEGGRSWESLGTRESEGVRGWGGVKGWERDSGERDCQDDMYYL